MEKEALYNTANIYLYLYEFGEANRFHEMGLEKWPAYLKGYPGILFDYSGRQFQNGDFTGARHALPLTHLVNSLTQHEYL